MVFADGQGYVGKIARGTPGVIDLSCGERKLVCWLVIHEFAAVLACPMLVTYVNSEASLRVRTRLVEGGIGLAVARQGFPPLPGDYSKARRPRSQNPRRLVDRSLSRSFPGAYILTNSCAPHRGDCGTRSSGTRSTCRCPMVVRGRSAKSLQGETAKVEAVVRYVALFLSQALFHFELTSITSLSNSFGNSSENSCIVMWASGDFASTCFPFFDNALPSFCTRTVVELFGASAFIRTQLCGSSGLANLTSGPFLGGFATQFAGMLSITFLGTLTRMMSVFLAALIARLAPPGNPGRRNEVPSAAMPVPTIR